MVETNGVTFDCQVICVVDAVDIEWSIHGSELISVSNGVEVEAHDDNDETELFSFVARL